MSSIKKKNVDDKVISDKAGVTYSNWWNFLPAEAFTSGKFVENMPDADWTIIGEPAGPNGEKGTVQTNPITSSGLQFGKHMENEREKMIKYLQIFDATCFDLEMYEKIHYGVEGETYEKKQKKEIIFIYPLTIKKKRELSTE